MKLYRAVYDELGKVRCCVSNRGKF